MVYLDNAATTKPDERIADTVARYMLDEYFNPGSIHLPGLKVRKDIEEAREHIADLINCSPENIIFTSSGSEANNLAIMGLYDELLKRNKTHIVMSAYEHASVRKTIENMCIKPPFYYNKISVEKNGTISPKSIANAIIGNTGMAAIMFTNNELGTSNDVEKIAEICRKNNTLFHTDCVQAVGFQNIDVSKINCDSLSMSAHKIHGLKGCGALYVRDPSLYKPIIYGGAGQEFGIRGGTENVLSIISMGEACKYLKEEMSRDVAKIRKVKNVFVEQLSELFRHRDILHFNSDPEHSGKILNIRIDGVDGETLLKIMSDMDICISTGAACNGSEKVASKSLMAIGLTDTQASESIRVSFSKNNTEEEAILAAASLATAAGILLEMREP